MSSRGRGYVSWSPLRVLAQRALADLAHAANSRSPEGAVGISHVILTHGSPSGTG